MQERQEAQSWTDVSLIDQVEFVQGEKVIQLVLKNIFSQFFLGNFDVGLHIVVVSLGLFEDAASEVYTSISSGL